MDGPDPFAVSSGVGDYAPLAPPAFQLDPSIQQDIGASFGPPNPAGPSLGVATDLGPMPTANELGLVPGTGDAGQAMAAVKALDAIAGPPQVAPVPEQAPLPPPTKPGEPPAITLETPEELRGDVERQQAKDQAGARVHQEAIDADAKAAALAEASWGTHQANLQKRQNDYDAHVADLQKSGTVDSEQWWQSRSAGQQFAAIFAAAAAGFLQGTKGGSNTAIDSMQKAIDNNIQAQQATFANKRAVLGLEQSGIENERTLGLEEFNHAQAERQAAWKGVEMKAAAAMAGVDPRGTQAEQYRKLMIAAQQKQQEVFFKTREANTKDAVANQEVAIKAIAEKETSRHNRADEGHAAGMLGVEREKLALEKGKQDDPVERQKRAEAQANLNGVDGVEYENGERVAFPDAASRTEIAKKTVATKKMDASLARLQYLSKDGWSPNLARSSRWQKAMSEYENAKLTMKDVYGVARYTELESEAFGKIVPDPTKRGIDSDIYGSARKMLHRGMDSELSQFETKDKKLKPFTGVDYKPAPEELGLSETLDLIKKPMPPTLSGSPELRAKWLDQRVSLIGGLADKGATPEAQKEIRQQIADGLVDGKFSAAEADAMAHAAAGIASAKTPEQESIDETAATGPMGAL